MAAVIPRKGQSVKAEHIHAFLKERLAGYKVPKKIIFAETFPEAGAGKVQKNVLKEIYAPNKG